MGGSSESTPQQGQPIIPQPGPSINGAPPQTDPMSYSDPTNTPDPMIEAIKGIASMMGYGPSAAPPSAPKRRY